jgi:hypothetical protein
MNGWNRTHYADERMQAIWPRNPSGLQGCSPGSRGIPGDLDLRLCRAAVGGVTLILRTTSGVSSMTVSLEKQPTRTRPVRSSRWAWVALLLTPVLGLLSISLVLFVHAFAVSWWGGVLVLGLAYAPPAVAVVVGLRSALSGNRSGAHAFAVATAWFAFWVAFWYLANYPYNSGSAAVPLWLGAVAAAVAGAAVETWYWLRASRGAR